MPHFSHLHGKKNLLAFSAGVDSSALFFMLLEQNISFDIALVNYATREQSIEEELYARELATKYQLQVHIAKAPKFTSHFEANARSFRYEFFESLIEAYHYENLITAHQLNDQLEWFFMRLSKGAGLFELLGLESVSHRVSPHGSSYSIVRPVLERTKQELLEYLQVNNHRYYVDASNSDEKYERNYIRKRLSEPFLAEFSDGIRRSMTYLREDKVMLFKGVKLHYANKALRVYQLASHTLKTRASDIALKELGYLLSALQRQEIETSQSLVIGGKWAIEFQDNRLYIAPYIVKPMPKEYKEYCRKVKLPRKIRSYCYREDIVPLSVMQ